MKYHHTRGKGGWQGDEEEKKQVWKGRKVCELAKEGQRGFRKEKPRFLVPLVAHPVPRLPAARQPASPRGPWHFPALGAAESCLLSGPCSTFLCAEGARGPNSCLHHCCPGQSQTPNYKDLGSNSVKTTSPYLLAVHARQSGTYFRPDIMLALRPSCRRDSFAFH